jgi:membrane-associated protease RseP (regulator of RpoE activity)
VATTTLAGADLMYLFARDLPVTVDLDRYAMILTTPGLWWAGFAFSVPLLLILGAHELGHFLVCEFYGVRATLPYFIPVPTPLGTMGAFIRIKQPIYTRERLFDIAVGGPLAGFAVLLPILLVSLTWSRVHVGLHDQSDLAFGSPWLIRVLSGWLFPGVPVDDLYLHPSARAAWVGLLATALNLLPIGQLDGGHILYAVFGERARWVFRVFLAALVPMGFLFSYSWLGWAVLLLFFGLKHPVIYDLQPLGRRRLWLALLALLIFAASFDPAPLPNR